MRYLLFIILVFITLTVHSQVDNPFDINRSNVKINLTQVKTQDTLSETVELIEEANSLDVQPESSTNIFEVSRNGSQIKAPSIIEIHNNDEYTIPVPSVNSRDTNSFGDEPEIIEIIPTHINHNSIPIGTVETKIKNPFELKKIDNSSNTITKSVHPEVSITKEKVKNKIYTSTLSKSKSFPFWISLFSIVIVALVINLNKSILSRLLNSITNDNILKQNMRNDNSGINVFYLSFYIIFILEIALFFYLYSDLKINQIEVSSWWIIAISVFIAIVIKHLLLFLIGKIFHLESIFNEYSFTILVYNILFGVFLIPVNLLIAYGPDGMSDFFLYSSVIVGLLLALFCYMRSIFSLGRDIKDNILYFFLYLCTFEIIPVLILVKNYIN